MVTDRENGGEMTSAKWIKLNIDMFDKWQIRELRSLPEGDTAMVIYLYLLTQAVRSNQGGVLVFNEHIPITNTSIANQLGIKERTVEMAIQALIKLELLTDVDGILNVVGLEEFMYTDPMELIRQKDRERKRKLRERQKQALIEVKEDVDVIPMIPVVNRAIEAITATKQEDAVPKEDIKKVIDAWNAITERTGLRKLTKLTSGSNRYKWLVARILEYGMDDVLKAIDLIPDCTYILDKGWFNFEWFVRPSNFPKVLEGNYLDPNKKKRVLETKAKPETAEEPKELTDEEWLEMMRNS